MTKIRQEPQPIVEARTRELLEACAGLMGAGPEPMLAAAAKHLPKTPTEQAVTLLTHTATQLRLATRAMVNFQLSPRQRWQLADPILRRAYHAAREAVTEDLL